VQQAASPGAAIGVNGLAGNLGIAAAALVTGYFVEHVGWRAAFVVPGLVTMGFGVWFMIAAPKETEPPSQRARKAALPLSRSELARALAVMTLASASGGLIFNLTTNGNGQLLAERFLGVVEDPSTLGTMLAVVYAVASLAQVVVGRLIDRFPLKTLQLAVVLCQVPMLWWAAHAQGWMLFAALLGSMVFIFGGIPFTDATIVRYVDDRMRSRVAGMRLAISLGISSAAVWALGPAVKAAGFATLFNVMAGVALFTAAVVWFLPGELRRQGVPASVNPR
jgi:predicted MFS family arabinose efflux permease